MAELVTAWARFVHAVQGDDRAREDAAADHHDRHGHHHLDQAGPALRAVAEAGMALTQEVHHGAQLMFHWKAVETADVELTFEVTVTVMAVSVTLEVVSVAVSSPVAGLIASQDGGPEMA